MSDWPETLTFHHMDRDEVVNYMNSPPDHAQPDSGLYVRADLYDALKAENERLSKMVTRRAS